MITQKSTHLLVKQIGLKYDHFVFGERVRYDGEVITTLGIIEDFVTKADSFRHFTTITILQSVSRKYTRFALRFSHNLLYYAHSYTSVFKSHIQTIILLCIRNYFYDYI